MDYKSIIDKNGAEVKMAGRLGADGFFRPVHHSEQLTLQAAFTRPANTTAYIAGDAVGAAGNVLFLFDLAAANVPAGLIVAARLIRSDVASPATRYRAMVHDAAPAASPAADNDPAPLTWANRVSRRGWIDFLTSMAGAAAGSDCLEYAGQLSSPGGLPVAPADGKLRLILQTLDGYVPASGVSFLIELDLIV